jgi:hypothetical protein
LLACTVKLGWWRKDDDNTMYLITLDRILTVYYMLSQP